MQAQAQGKKAGFQTSYQEKDSKQVQRRQRKKWISNQHTQSKERKGALYLTSLSSDNCTEALFPTPADRTTSFLVC